jgi:hypothetical protein
MDTFKHGIGDFISELPVLITNELLWQDILLMSMAAGLIFAGFCLILLILAWCFCPGSPFAPGCECIQIEAVSRARADPDQRAKDIVVPPQYQIQLPANPTVYRSPPVEPVQEFRVFSS